MENLSSLIAMLVSEVLIIFTFFFVLWNQKKKSQLKNAILTLLACMYVCLDSRLCTTNTISTFFYSTNFL